MYLDQGGVDFQYLFLFQKGEDSHDHKRRGGKKNGAGSDKGSRRKRKSRLIEDTLIGKKAL